MSRPHASETLIRGTALYLPIAVVLAAGHWRPPDRKRVAGAVTATAWNVPAILALNAVAVRAGWWEFHAEHAAVTHADIPVELWLGWAVLWGVVPILFAGRIGLPALALVMFDLVVMPAAEPVVELHTAWLLGEALAVLTCLLPGVLLGLWTARDTHLPQRALLQVVAFSGVLLYVVPTLAMEATHGHWSDARSAPWALAAVAAIVVIPATVLGLLAVAEFVRHGGTPLPLDPPKRLVTSGPYGFLANPMQVSGAVLVIGLALLLRNPWVLASALAAVAFSAGIAGWNEDEELSDRYGDDWRRYRQHVRAWVPTFRRRERPSHPPRPEC